MEGEKPKMRIVHVKEGGDQADKKRQEGETPIYSIKDFKEEESTLFTQENIDAKKREYDLKRLKDLLDRAILNKDQVMIDHLSSILERYTSS